MSQKMVTNLTKRERRERKERRERRKTVPEGFQIAAEPDALDKTLILGSTIYALGDIWMAA